MRRKQRLKDKAKKLREKDIERRRRELVKEREKKAEEKRKEKEAAKAEMDEEEEVCLCYLHSSMFNMTNVKTTDHLQKFHQGCYQNKEVRHFLLAFFAI